jgi:hypothetical protein
MLPFSTKLQLNLMVEKLRDFRENSVYTMCLEQVWIHLLASYINPVAWKITKAVYNLSESSKCLESAR